MVGFHIYPGYGTTFEEVLECFWQVSVYDVMDKAILFGQNVTQEETQRWLASVKIDELGQSLRQHASGGEPGRLWKETMCRAICACVIEEAFKRGKNVNLSIS